MKAIKSSRGIGRRRSQRGFTMLELAIATVILLVGIVSVVQLVPASIGTNMNNRYDTKATVLGQRMIEQFALQPLTAATFTDADGNILNLGNPATPGVVVGSPLVAGAATIDFTQATVAGYNLQYVDPNDPQRGSYDIRWAVITTVNAGTPVVKRFVVGVRRFGAKRIPLTVNFDTTVSK